MLLKAEHSAVDKHHKKKMDRLSFSLPVKPVLPLTITMSRNLSPLSGTSADKTKIKKWVFLPEKKSCSIRFVSKI